MSNDFDQARELLHRQMLSGVSHDLKTPLATIIGSLEIYTLMAEKLSPEKKHALLHSALGEAYRLDGFINNILDMAKLESGLVKVDIAPHDFTLMMNECVSRLGPLTKSGTILLQPNLDSITIYTDAILLARATRILLDNALKHAGKNPTVIVEYAATADEIRIQVQDNGPGIAPGKEELIFSKYTRIPSSDQQNAGTGLGLALCCQIMKLLSGTAKGHNHPAGGAVFTLLCPNHSI